MLDRHFRLLMVLAVAVGALPPPLLAQGTFCHPINISLSGAFAGANWSSILNGYQITGACNYSFDCSNGNFGSCQLCLLVVILTDPDHDGSYSGPAGKGTNQSGVVECGSVGKTGTFNAGPFPSMGAGLPANDPYKVKYYAVAGGGAGCSTDPTDYDFLVTVTETTPPF